MADATVADPPPTDVLYGDGLPIPPLDDTFLSECFPNADGQNDVVLDDIDFDFSFDELYLPPFDETDDNNDVGVGFLPVSDDPTEKLTRNESFNPDNFQPDHHNALRNGSINEFKTTSPDFPNSESPASSNNSRVLNSTVSGDISSYLNVQSPENHRISGDQSCDVTGYVNVPSPELDGSNKACSGARILNCLSPVESQGSGNCRSNVSEGDSNKSACSSPNFVKNSIKSGVVDQQIKLEGYVKNENNVKVIDIDSDSNKNCLLKRKKDSQYSDNNNGNDSNVDSRTHKYRKSNSKSHSGGENDSSWTEEDEKRKARLMRNRESAQLSRQRKKHYVEELEDKLRTMHSTIQDLNAKYSYVMAENATLRQQLAGGSAVPPPMAAPPPGMYPPPPMMYPWMPVPPYMVKPQGSKVPLVPIPRLKPQQPVSAPKTSKKAESKKNEGKTKKVASVSFLGLLFFIFLFGGLVPMVNVRYGAREAFMGGSDFVGNGMYEKHRGRVLNVNGSGFGEKFNGGPNFTSNVGCPRSGRNGGDSSKHGGDEFVRARNESEPLMASLYVPRNDKLVKIDGNLIIHSVLASEKAMASREVSEKKKSDETGLVVSRNIAPAVPVSGMGRNGGRHPHLALGYAEKENLKSTAADGRLQQWFREGLAGPMLSSGMCTEVFQFEVSPASPPGGIIPATSARNVSADRTQNSTHVNKALNRRILHGVPIPLPGSSAHNVSKNHTAGRDSQNGNFNQTNSPSSMVVSVLFDPREAGDSDGDDMIGSKSLSRIFVVVMIDSVKYVTYSCMLPFIKGTVPHLVAA